MTYIARSLTLAGLLTFSLSVLHSDPARADANSATHTKPALTVELTSPNQKNWPRTISANGAIKAWQEAAVSSEVGGLRISKLLVDVGSEVHRGQELAQLDDAPVQAELKQREATVAQMQAGLREADSNANRATKLSGSGAMSDQQAQKYLIDKDTAKANLDAAEADVERTKIRLANTRILAPDDGVIISRNADLGTVVGAGTLLFRMVRQNRLEWRAEVTAGQMQMLKPGMVATVTLSDGQQIMGKVRMLGPDLNETTRMGLAYIDLPQNSPAKAGMYAGGEIQLGDTPALVLPQAAVVLRDGFSYVFVLEGKDHVRQQQITVGRQRNGFVEVLQGLTPKDRVVITGAAFLNDGDKVEIAGAKPQ